MTEKISDSVGKKIVEALKKQSEGAVAVEDATEEIHDYEQEIPSNNDFENNISTINHNDSLATSSITEEIPQYSNSFSSQSVIDNAFTQSLNQNLGTTSSFSSTPISVELPANIAVLNNLITKLPTGVSKQTGALIIRQTMEALGISMQSVIQEAKQVQDDLASRARECQKNIIDYRNQINILEQQAQQYQRQAVAMNDIIGLFVHSK